MTTTIARQPLTAKQQDVLEWIDGFVNTHGYSPSVKEIAHHYGWANNGVMCHLRALRRKGHVTWVDGRSRTLRLVEDVK